MIVRRGAPERARRLDVGLLADADHVVADHAEVLGHVDDRDRDRRGDDPLAELVGEQEGDHDRQQQVGEGEQGVVDQHQHAVELAADVARDQAERNADRDREDHRQHDHLDRGPRAPDHPREHVGRLHGGAEGVRPAGRGLLGEAHPVRLDLVEAVRGDQGREDRQDQEQDDDRGARCRAAASALPRPV